MKYLFGALIILFTISLQAQDGFKRPNIPGELMVDVGFNVWSTMPGDLERSVWPSKSVGIYYTRRKVINKGLSFNYGIGLGLEKMSLGDTVTLASNTLDDGGTPDDGSDDFVREVEIITNPENFDKNKLAMTYLDIPLEFRFHPQGTEDGEGLFLGVGVVAGLRLRAHTKWKYENNGETTREKQTGDFNLNSFRYGYQIRAGFRGVHLFYKRYLSETFQGDFPDGTNPTMTTIGINVTGF